MFLVTQNNIGLAMEHLIMIEQYQTDLASVVAQSRSLGKEIAITHNGEVLAYISPKIEKPKRQLNFGFMNEEFDVPDDFDRMNEDEIYAMFAGEYGENPFR